MDIMRKLCKCGKYTLGVLPYYYSMFGTYRHSVTYCGDPNEEPGAPGYADWAKPAVCDHVWKDHLLLHSYVTECEKCHCRKEQK